MIFRMDAWLDNTCLSVKFDSTLSDVMSMSDTLKTKLENVRCTHSIWFQLVSVLD